ncbi:rpe: ribulose-phosphate 3-epimerase [Rubrobacter radiotolerans]|uniref:Ribulose-phosphate 3-epimerase n=1 Tax=Rubrobacter radiotolerans TaxID=42256 RepID=A0A023X2H8_RUBRA|nr:ribulose-phosphate 3-epimerase [Rubrobacter radiotolerans]AHY46652.1 rpe: ribulose-phosphate 3-epimerase [Rubrobacter radiotolerans]MDX5894059.1 ribulose-phosphate 3-epimerase [Rubrobacter radiotolerans]SMC05086.1 ribulose-5-phosphate 3-epimerase [Rubrobacter radiotolerans DSM 5868]
MAFWRELGERVVGGPSILSADFAHLAKDVERTKAGGAEVVHFDVMDNHFVPNLTVGPAVAAALVRATDLPVDAHLQVERPESLVPAFAEAGVASITLQPETALHLHRTLTLIKDSGCEAGVALTPATPPESLRWVAHLLDYVLVMSVEPGFGGQRFIPESVEKVRRVRELYGLPVQADGGITPVTAPRMVRAGAQVLVAGSAVFDGGDPERDMRKLIEAGRSGR